MKLARGFGGGNWLGMFEVGAVALLFIADWRGLIPVSKTPFLLLLAWISLRLRRVRWREIGLRRLGSWARTLGMGAACGVVLWATQLFVVQAAVARLLGRQPDLSDLEPLIGNLKMTLVVVALSWVLAACGEEMVYRGYLMNRLTDWVGRTRRAWIGSALVVSVVFGLAHANQGPTGMVVEGIAGLWLGLVYLGAGRNLFVAIVAHGVQNTIDLLLVYFGKFPGM